MSGDEVKETSEQRGLPRCRLQPWANLFDVWEKVSFGFCFVFYLFGFFEM